MAGVIEIVTGREVEPVGVLCWGSELFILVVKGDRRQVLPIAELAGGRGLLERWGSLPQVEVPADVAAWR